MSAVQLCLAGLDKIEVMQKKKDDQLGMPLGTASHRLRMAIMFKLVAEAGHLCFRCGGELTLESFSIEHKIPWLHSEDPIELFFDLDNIAFSHLGCNMKAKRISKKYQSIREGDRVRSRGYWAAKSKDERQALRRRKYLLYGK